MPERGNAMPRTSVGGLIRTKYNMLSASQKKVADYVLANMEKVITLSLADLSSACNVSEPTVMRFLHKLDYKSYQVFRVNIAQESAMNTGQSLYSDVTSGDSTATVIEKVIASTKCSLDDLPHVLDPNAIEELCKKIREAARVFIIGVGSTTAIAFDLQHKLLKLGIETRFCNDPHIINISCSNLNSNAVLIAISHSGESREILDGVELAKKTGCWICAITSFPRSSLIKRADTCIISSSHETTYRSDAMTSRIIQMCIIDMIYIRLALMGASDSLEKINISRIAVAHNKT